MNHTKQTSARCPFIIEKRSRPVLRFINLWVQMKNVGVQQENIEVQKEKA